MGRGFPGVPASGGVRAADGIRRLADVTLAEVARRSATGNLKEVVQRLLGEADEGPRHRDLTDLAGCIAAIEARQEGWRGLPQPGVRENLFEIGALHSNDFGDLVESEGRLAWLDHGLKAPREVDAGPSYVVEGGRPMSWTMAAAPVRHRLNLKVAEVDILGLCHRIVVDRGGWKGRDRWAGQRNSVALIPLKLAEAAKKADRKERGLSRRAYERAIPALTRIGLLAWVGHEGGRYKSYVPLWHPAICADPYDLFARAAELRGNGVDEAGVWGGNGGGLANDPVRVMEPELPVRIAEYERRKDEERGY